MMIFHSYVSLPEGNCFEFRVTGLRMCAANKATKLGQLHPRRSKRSDCHRVTCRVLMCWLILIYLDISWYKRVHSLEYWTRPHTTDGCHFCWFIPPNFWVAYISILRIIVQQVSFPFGATADVKLHCSYFVVVPCAVHWIQHSPGRSPRGRHVQPWRVCQ
jgi:hypothetical protein